MMPVFSGNEQKRLGTEQALRRQKKKKVSLHRSSFLFSAWFLFFPSHPYRD